MTTVSVENPEFSQPDHAPQQPFADLTLGQLVRLFIRQPRQTWRLLAATLPTTPSPASIANISDQTVAGAATIGPVSAAPATRSAPSAPRTFAMPAIDGQAMITLSALAVIVLLGLFGSSTLAGTQTVAVEAQPLPVGAIILLLAAGAFAVLIAVNMPPGRLQPLKIEAAHRQRFDVREWVTRHAFRLFCLGIALIATSGAWFLNVDVRGQPTEFTDGGIFVWIISILAWIGALFDRPVTYIQTLQRIARSPYDVVRSTLRFRITWTLVALVAILIIGAWLRFHSLEQYPPDMTSDHVEKARDAWMISGGFKPIFLANNGGREPGHFYLLALLHNLTQLPFGFDLLKIGSGLWGMAMILCAYWMGRAVIGDEDKDLGNLTGIIMAALVATSYWAVMLSRLGLRIVSTTVITTAIIIFFVRALRNNRRADWIITGLLLGVGVYFYQAMRMLPVVIVAGFLLVLAVRVRQWRVLRQYVVNIAALSIVAVAVFVPMANYMQTFPDLFWSRSSGRLFGEPTIQVKDDQGNVIGERMATTEDQLRALAQNLPVLGSNMIRSVWMFNWRGDTAWVTGLPAGTPEMDLFTGSFFAFGIGLIIVRMIRRRDPADWLLPISILIMLLPTALSIAFVIEVPSSTRASGTFPMAYFLAALAMAVAVKLVWQRFTARVVRIGALVVVGIAIGFGAMANYNTYFEQAMGQYRQSTLPYRQAGEVFRGFAESVGSSGNVFMIAYPYWWDHRALAIEAGDIRWDNGILEDNVEGNVLAKMRANVGTPYEVRPDRQMMFFIHPEATGTLAVLQSMFPNGQATRIPAYNSTRDFVIYTSDPVGCKWIMEEVQASTLCQ